MSISGQLSLTEIKAFKKLQESLLKHYKDHNCHDHPYSIKTSDQCKVFIESVSSELKTQLQSLTSFLEENKFEYVHNFLQILILLLEKPICPHAFSIIDYGNLDVVSKYLEIFIPLLKYNRYEYVMTDLQQVIYHILRSITETTKLEQILQNIFDFLIQLSQSLLQTNIIDEYTLFSFLPNNKISLSPIYLQHLSCDNNISYFQSLLYLSIQLIETNQRLCYSKSLNNKIITIITDYSYKLLLLYPSLVDSICKLYYMILCNISSSIYNNSYYFYILQCCIQLIISSINKKVIFYKTEYLTKCLFYFYNNQFSFPIKMKYIPQNINIKDILLIVNSNSNNVELFISFLYLYLSTYYDCFFDTSIIDVLLKEYHSNNNNNNNNNNISSLFFIIASYYISNNQNNNNNNNSENLIKIINNNILENKKIFISSECYCFLYYLKSITNNNYYYKISNEYFLFYSEVMILLLQNQCNMEENSIRLYYSIILKLYLFMNNINNNTEVDNNIIITKIINNIMKIISNGLESRIQLVVEECIKNIPLILLSIYNHSINTAANNNNNNNSMSDMYCKLLNQIFDYFITSNNISVGMYKLVQECVMKIICYLSNKNNQCTICTNSYNLLINNNNNNNNSVIYPYSLSHLSYFYKLLCHSNSHKEMKFNLFHSIVNHCDISSSSSSISEWKEIISQIFNKIACSNNRMIYHILSCYFTNNYQCIKILFPSESIYNSIKLFITTLTNIVLKSKVKQLYITLMGITFCYVPFEKDYFHLFSQYIYQCVKFWFEGKHQILVYDSIHSILNSHKLSFSELLNNLDSNISISILQNIFSTDKCKDGLIFIKEYFNCTDIVEYLNMTCEIILPECILKQNTELLELINKNLTDKVINDNLATILYHIFTEPSVDLTIPLNYITKIYPQFKSTQDIIDKTHRLKLIKLLVWDLGNDKTIERTLTVLDILSGMFYVHREISKPKENNSNNSHRNKNKNNKNVVEIEDDDNDYENKAVIMIKEDFLYLLFQINQSIQKSAFIYNKIHSLKVLNQLIIFMKNEIQSYIPNIISTLMSIQDNNHSSILYAICEIYHSLLTCIDDEILANYVDIFFVVLIKYFLKYGNVEEEDDEEEENDKNKNKMEEDDDFEGEGNNNNTKNNNKEKKEKREKNELSILLDKIFTELLQNNINLISPLFIKYDFLFSSLPKQNKFSEYIPINPNKSFNEMIMQLNTILIHENSIIVEIGLKELYKVLSTHRKELINSLVQDQYININIQTLLQNLFNVISFHTPSCTASHHNNLVLLCAKIFGEIGAIDPSKILVLPQIESTFHDELPQEELAVRLICDHMCKSLYSVTDIGLQNRIAFGIQELLKYIYKQKVMDDYPEQFPSVFYTLFPENIIPIITPYWYTRYEEVVNPNILKPPIYQNGMLYDQWVIHFSKYLIKNCNSEDKILYNACEGIISISITTAAFLLPYLIVSVLKQNSQSDFDLILLEFRTIFNECVKGGNGNLYQCVELILFILDQLTFWGNKNILDYPTDKLIQLINQISYLDRTRCAIECKSYTRGLLYYENHLFNKRKEKREFDYESDDIHMLYSLFDKLNDNDNKEGIINIRTNEINEPLSIEEKIMRYKLNNNYTEALLCYEYLYNNNSMDLYNIYNGMIENWKYLGQYELISTNIESLEDKNYGLYLTLIPSIIEAKSKMGKWDEITANYTHFITTKNNILYNNNQIINDQFGIYMNLLLLSIYKKDYSHTKELLNNSLNHISDCLSASIIESYNRSYDNILQLHILNEINEYFNIIISNENNRQIDVNLRLNEVFNYWENRYNIITPQLNYKTDLLFLHRTLYGFCNKKEEISKCWLEESNQYKNNGNYIYSEYCLLYDNTFDFIIAKAELNHLRGKTKESLDELMNIMKWDLSSQKYTAKEFAKCKLLYTIWSSESGRIQTDELKNNFYDIIRHYDSSSEDAYYHFAKLIDDTSLMFSDLTKYSTLKNHSSCVEQAIKLYGNTLQHGVKYLYECLPRLMTIWFNTIESINLYLAANNSEKTSSSSSSTSDIIKQNKDLDALKTNLNKQVCTLFQNINYYQWYIISGQLLSRICHPDNSVREIVSDIIVKLLNAFPQQMIWNIISLTKKVEGNVDEQRRKNALNLLEKVKSLDKKSNNSKSINKSLLFMAVDSLDDKLTTLAKKKATTNTIDCQLNIKNLISAKIVVPIKSTLTISLPNDISERNDEITERFPNSNIIIKDFDREAQIMASKERPKTVVCNASNGRKYKFLCKTESKGDLRKDSRLMDFATLINRLFNTNIESRKRKLHIRTYSVICLTADTGLLEWVSNTQSFNSCMAEIYNEKPQVKLRLISNKYQELQKRSYNDIKSQYKTEILSRFPLEFHKWFMKHFVDPTKWYENKQNYIRSCSVWCILGHIIGLGDRHGENILIDTKNSECVHVDFDCIFDKGLSLRFPEVVPFRLTPNIVDGMGVMGVEGAFRKSCEITMKVCRDNRNELINQLDPFIHDPLVEWNKRRNTSSDNGMILSFLDPQITLDRVKERLNGISKSNQLPSHNLPLNVEGQVNLLINEAKKPENLYKMYMGWMPFL